MIIVWEFADGHFAAVWEEIMIIVAINCEAEYFDLTRTVAVQTIVIGNQKTLTLPGIFTDAVLNVADPSLDSSCAVKANLLDVNGDLIPEALASLPDGQFFD